LVPVAFVIMYVGFAFAVPPPPCTWWGDSSTFNGRPITCADTITARDPDGVWCGRQYACGDGKYAIHVYGDDPETSEDEGAVEGDTIAFYINGYKAEVVSGSAIWHSGVAHQLELAASSVSTACPSSSAGDEPLPARFGLSQNFPNPFNPTTNIEYQIPKSVDEELVIYDIFGRKVRTLVDREQPAGYYSITWNGRDDFGREVGAGIYLYRLRAGNFVDVRKMVRLR